MSGQQDQYVTTNFIFLSIERMQDHEVEMIEFYRAGISNLGPDSWFWYIATGHLKTLQVFCVGVYTASLLSNSL